MAGFGPNEWLVDEIYQQYLTDKNSVDPAWWDFFEDYQPADATLPRAERASGNGTRTGSVRRRARRVPRAGRRRRHRAAPAAPADAPSGHRRRAGSAVTPAAPARPRRRPRSSDRRCAAPPRASWTTWRASLAVPTATSVRAVPAKLLIDNRIVINNHLARARGGKVSFTHLIGWAVVQALRPCRR